MSRIAFEPNLSGTATFTIASPATNTNRILTLPDAAGTLNFSGLANEVPAGSAASPSIYPTGDNNTGIFFPAADTIAFAEGGAEVARFDSSGNMGLGVIPSTWTNGHAIQIGPGRGGSLFVERDSFGYTTLNSNAYYNSGWKYETTTLASSYRQLDGVHLWYVAPSGTADNAITFTEAMRIDSAGRCRLGGNGFAYTGSSQLVITRDSPSVYNNSHLELLSLAGDVVIGFHAGGASAVCMDHVRSTNYLRVVNLDRTAYAPIYASAFTVNSDYRLKENLTPLTDAATRLMQIPVHRFSFIENSMSYQNGQMVDGFLAHEVEDIVPEAVLGTKDAVNESGEAVYQGIDQSKLVPLLTAALQEALTKIEALEARINALESQ